MRGPKHENLHALVSTNRFLCPPPKLCIKRRQLWYRDKWAKVPALNVFHRQGGLAISKQPFNRRESVLIINPVSAITHIVCPFFKLEPPIKVNRASIENMVPMLVI